MQHPRWLLPVVIFFLFGKGDLLWGQSGGIGFEPQTEQVLFIGAINFDCYPDTVTGAKVGGTGGYLPRRILWGIPQPDKSGKINPDCSGRTPLQKKKGQTVIVYPQWDIQGGSVSFNRLNADSLIDMVIHIRGKVIQKEKDNSLEKDSLRCIGLFGQHGLDSIPVIQIGQVRRFQSAPFFAMELMPGSELTQPATRDLSGAISYVLEPVNLELDDRDPAGPRPIMPVHSISGVDKVEMAAEVQVYPNPTSNTVQIRAVGLDGGNYILQLVSVNGEVELREEVTLQQGAELSRTFDVQHLSNGFYVVRVDRSDKESSGEAVMVTQPIIITR